MHISGVIDQHLTNVPAAIFYDYTMAEESAF
jgi:hypothetical protein